MWDHPCTRPVHIMIRPSFCFLPRVPLFAALPIAAAALPVTSFVCGGAEGEGGAGAGSAGTAFGRASAFVNEDEREEVRVGIDVLGPTSAFSGDARLGRAELGTPATAAGFGLVVGVTSGSGILLVAKALEGAEGLGTESES